MSFNAPTTNKTRTSFGPAIIFLGATGATPTVDIGGIRTDDGVTCEVTNEVRDVMQGNPKLSDFVFSQAQGFDVMFTSIEWNFDTFLKAFGSGDRVVVGATTSDSFQWGGDPIMEEVALRVQHIMPQTGHTLYVNVWRAVSKQAPNLPFIHDEHPFEMAFRALKATDDWAGGSLLNGNELFQVFEEY